MNTMKMTIGVSITEAEITSNSEDESQHWQGTRAHNRIREEFRPGNDSGISLDHKGKLRSTNKGSTDQCNHTRVPPRNRDDEQ